MDPLLTNAELLTTPLIGRVTVCSRCGLRPVCYPTARVCHRCPVLAAPTRAAPGSEAKIQLMTDRDSAGLPIWVPGDLHNRDLTAEDVDPRPFYAFTDEEYDDE